ncbi:MAG TPA: MFS transporter [Candidatus Mediterraneibacter intestinigallinarum]|nr:MFS transporter [Candidatus Mediterraneibacter intestinigallinarum]
MKEKLWTYQYGVLVLANTFNSFGFYMITTILSTYLTESGIALSAAGVIVGMFSVTSLIIRPFCGILSDRANKVKLLLISFLLAGMGTIGYSIIPRIGPIVVFRILHGIGFGISSTVLITIAVYFIPEKRMGEGIGYLGISQVIASAVAPGLGIAIAEITGYKPVFWLAGGFVLIAVLMVYICRRGLGEEKTGKVIKEKHAKQSFCLRDIIAVEALGYTLISGVYSFTNGVITAFILLFAQKKGITGISIYFTVCAAVLFISKPASGKLVDRKGLAVAVYPATILSGISMFMLGHAEGIGIILLSGIIRSIGQGTAMPALQTECIRTVGIERSGVATSTYYLGGDVGQGIGPMIGGVVVGSMGYEGMFDICGILLLSMTVVFYYLEKRKRRESYEKRTGKNYA